MLSERSDPGKETPLAPLIVFARWCHILPLSGVCAFRVCFLSFCPPRPRGRADGLKDKRGNSAGRVSLVWKSIKFKVEEWSFKLRNRLNRVGGGVARNSSRSRSAVTYKSVLPLPRCQSHLSVFDSVCKTCAIPSLLAHFINRQVSRCLSSKAHIGIENRIHVKPFLSC